MDIDNKQGHFVTMLGSCWDDALIAGLPMRLELWDGSVREGVPASPAQLKDDDADELDHTGIAEHLELGGVTVYAHEVRSYAAFLPESHRPTES